MIDSRTRDGEGRVAARGVAWYNVFFFFALCLVRMGGWVDRGRV